MLHENFTTNSQQTCDTNATNATNATNVTADHLTTPETDQPTVPQTSSRTSSTSRVRACARVCAREDPQLPPIERLHVTKELYQQNIGRMTPAIANMIERCLLSGMEPDVVDAAIAKTGWARRPSPNYLAAILRRYNIDGIKTIDDLMADEARFEAIKEQRRAERAARWYEEDTCSELPF